MAKKTTVRTITQCSGIRSDRSQIFAYQTPEFPAYLQKINWKPFRRFQMTDHWHDEVEFVYVKKGVVNYTVEGVTVPLSAGEGIFVNSRKLHVNAQGTDDETEFYCAILHPMLLCASNHVDKTFVNPVIRAGHIPYLVLKETVDWQKEILLLVEKMYEALVIDNEPLTTSMLFFGLWQKLFSHLELTAQTKERPNHNLTTLKEMITCIHQRYPERISLDDIAQAGKVGKTMCISIFERYVNKTPGEFLREYRLHQASYLLRTTDLAVTEICYEIGFADASYFTKSFREYTGETPLAYRKRTSTEGGSHK